MDEDKDKEGKEEEIEEEAAKESEKFMANIQKMIDASVAKLGEEKEEIKSTKEVTKDEVDKMDKSQRISEFYTALIQNDKQKLQVLAEGTNALGGYLVPAVLYQDIIEELRDSAIIRSKATIIDPCPPHLDITNLASRPKVYWRGESAVKSTSTAEFGQISLTPYSLAVIVVLTRELVADAVIPASMTSYITRLLSVAIAEEEDKVFTTGNGTGRPTGIDAYAATIHRIVTTPANVLVPDSIIEAFYRLGSQYRKNAVWIMNSLTLTKAMQLKDSQNRYLFVADPTGVLPGTLLGKPVFEQNDLTQSHIWLADLRGYVIGIREGITVMQSEEAYVDTHSMFERNEIAIRVEERIDGETADLDSMVVITGTN